MVGCLTLTLLVVWAVYLAVRRNGMEDDIKTKTEAYHEDQVEATLTSLSSEDQSIEIFNEPLVVNHCIIYLKNNEGLEMMKVASINFFDLGKRKFGSQLRTLNWMSENLEDSNSVAIMDSYEEGFLTRCMPVWTRNFLHRKSGMKMKMAKIYVKAGFGFINAFYSQANLMFDLYLLSILISSHPKGYPLRKTVISAMATFIYFPLLANSLLEFLPWILAQKSWKKFLLLLCLPLMPVTTVLAEFIQKLRKTVIGYIVQRILAELFNKTREEVPAALAKTYQKGLEESRRKNYSIGVVLARMKLLDATLEGQPQSLMKILLMLLLVSETKVLSGVEAEFGQTDSLAPGVPNRILIIGSIILIVLKSSIFYQKFTSEVNSKIVPFTGKLILRNLAVNLQKYVSIFICA